MEIAHENGMFSEIKKPGIKKPLPRLTAQERLYITQRLPTITLPDMKVWGEGAKTFLAENLADNLAPKTSVPVSMLRRFFEEELTSQTKK